MLSPSARERADRAAYTARVSDDELQRLRREWGERGDRESEAAWLRAALRARVVAPAVVLARWWLGDPAAADALARPQHDEPDLAAWIRGLSAFDLGPCLEGPGLPAQGWGHPALVRASSQALQLLQAQVACPPELESPLELLQGWLSLRWPSEPFPAERVDSWRHAYESSPERSPAELLSLVAALTSAQAAIVPSLNAFMARLLSSWLKVNFSVAHRSIYEPGQVAAVAVSAVATRLSEAQVRAAIRERSLAWLRELSAA